MMESGAQMKDLALRIKQADEVAFGMLYAHFKTKLYWYCLKFTRCEETAKEVVHDIFVKLWEDKAQLNADLNISAFLFTIAKHKLINHLKKAALNTAYVLEQKRTTSEACSSAERGLEYGNYLELANRAVTQLPPRRQLIFTMSRQQELSHQEIAAALGISKNTVKEQIAKALKALRFLLEVKTGTLLVLACFYPVL
jgi:RNA polymerase sigma-70 factor (family 1)